ncbi:MAG: HdeD family acid-resistance protein [Actinomycetes bacterium]
MSMSSADASRLLGRSFGVVLAFGIATVALGIILMVFTEESVKFFAVICGIYLILSGVFMLVASFSDDVGTGGMRFISAVGGLLSILLGIVAFRGIAQAVVILALLIGVGWIIRGVADLVEGFANPGMPGRGWVIFIGLLSLLAGIVVLVWPAITLSALVWVSGLWLVALGIVEIIGSFQLRGMARDLST